MLVEVSTAVNYIISHLYNKLPRRRVDMLADELDRCIKGKCQGHWFPDQPMKGTAYRCLRVSGEHADQVMFQAARESGMDMSEIFSCLPDDLTLWLDPGQVSYRVGEKGIVRILFSEGSNPTVTQPQQNFSVPPDFTDPNIMSPVSPEISMTTHEFMGTFPNPIPNFNQSEPVTPDSNNQSHNFPTPLENLSASFGHVTLFPGSTNDPIPSWSASASPTNAPLLCQQGLPGPLQNYYLQKSTSTPNFTASSFAQTKFGSTKLKAPGAKRHNRLSPSEMTNYIPAAPPTCVSPTGQLNQMTIPGVLPNNYVNRSLSLSPSMSLSGGPFPTSPYLPSSSTLPVNSSLPSYEIPLILSPGDEGDTPYLSGQFNPNVSLNTSSPASTALFPSDQFHSANSSPEYSSNSPSGQDKDANCSEFVERDRTSDGNHEALSAGASSYQRLLLAN